MNADGVEWGRSPAERPDESDPPRSHRRGMLAGLGVLGLVLAGLLLFGPGGTRPRPAAQSQGGRSPVTIPVRSETTVATTTTTAPAAPTPKTAPVTDLAASTYQAKAPRPVEAPTPTTTPVRAPSTTVPRAPVAATTTTTIAVAPPPTTTTTSPPVTTTTSCILILCD